MSKRRWSVLVALLAVAVTALPAPAAQAAPSARSTPAAETAPATGRPAPLPAGPLVALGDSYSSGEGAPPFDPEAGACDRSPLAWPELAGASLGRPVVNLACSGAQTKDVTSPFKGQPAQTTALAALTPRPGVVTLTIGGNDAGFGPVLGLCVVGDCTGAVRDSQLFMLTALPERLGGTYRAVRAAAPGARLVVVGYPRLVPERQSEVAGCPWLDTKERTALNQAGALLDLVARFEAWRTGARFVDVSDTLRGHELCSADPWLVPIGAPGPSSSWAHPNPQGQQAIAARVAAALRR